MAINHYEDRPEDTKYPDRLKVGDIVKIIDKEHQGSRDENYLIEGVISRILSKGNFYENGVKVMIQLSENDFRYKDLGNAMFIGRVQYIVSRLEDRDNPYMRYVK